MTNAQQAEAALNALGAIADRLIYSDPSLLDTWNVDLSPCKPIAKAHLFNWSLDVCISLNPNSEQC